MVGVLASVKQLRKCALYTVIWVLQRGAKAEDMGEGSVLGRPHRVMLSYSRKKILSQTSVTISSRYHRLFLREPKGDIDLFPDR